MIKRLINKLTNSFKRKNLSVLDYLLKTNQYDEFVFLLSIYLNYNQEKKFNSSLKYFQTLSNSKYRYHPSINFYFDKKNQSELENDLMLNKQSDYLFLDRINELFKITKYKIEYCPKELMAISLEDCDKNNFISVKSMLQRNKYIYFQRKMLLPTLDDIEKIRKNINLHNINKVLDYGCGCGDVGLFFKIKKKNVFFADIEDGIIEYVEDRLALRNLSANIIKISSNNTNELPKEKFDLINCVEVIEHLLNPEQILEYFYNSMNETSYLILGSFPFNETNDKGDHITSTVSNQVKILRLINQMFKIISDEKSIKILQKKII